MSQDFIVIRTIVYMDLPVPAKHLCEDDAVLFGGSVWTVADAEFDKDSKYPDDCKVTLHQLRKVEDGKIAVTKQTVTVSREFEFQRLIISVVPKTTFTEDNDAAKANAS